MVSQQQIIDWINGFTAVIAEKKDYLTELDAAIGDADHGINMNRGFQKVSEKLPTVIDQDIGTILKTVSMTLISTVGGASGPLYGTFFLKASAVAAQKEELTPEELVKLLQAGLEGVIYRGKAQLEDKTMIDALSPAVDAFQQSLADNNSVVEGLQKAVNAAEEGMKKTIPLIARKGRASYLGERSVGHQDPGATSSYLMLTTLLKAVQKGK
ncbi:dihydroxyacetone kinase subunit DhaL [Pleurocapsa sp. PCC 7319]|uniref:dihydroxyacetone kinase subunit DhaL n=1 Tax=Pleurocapsa sp. PCC 7319 TaxID=118161 RepID=UPI00034B84B7|nr:dihydroxyacetone kinase subunit DhaL [Pleurocapsa sp. PCC 7319]